MIDSRVVVVRLFTVTGFCFDGGGMLLDVKAVVVGLGTTLEALSEESGAGVALEAVFDRYTVLLSLSSVM